MFTQSLLIRILIYIDYVTKTLSVSAWALASLTVWVFFHIFPVNKTKTISTLRVLLILVVLIAFKANTSLIFYIFFELSILPIIATIFLFGYQPEKLDASLYLTLYTVLASLPLLTIIIRKTNLILTLASVFYTLAFIVKTPIYIVHIWLPKAHVQAPVGGSIVLAGILLKLGSYGLFIFFLYVKNSLIVPIYFTLSIIGRIVRRIICIRQSDIKSLIAYSSVVHIGSVTLGLCSQTIIGYNAALFIVLGHGWCSPIIFALAFFTYLRRHSRLLVMRSIVVSPIFLTILICMCMCNIGLPPSLNLWSELWACCSTLTLLSTRAIGLIIIFFLGVLYNLTLYVIVAHSKPRGTIIPREVFSWGPIISLVILIRVFICLPTMSLA